MKSAVLVLVSALLLFLVCVITPDLPSAAGNQEYFTLAERASRELLIGWKDGVSDAERDRIIEKLGGKLKHRFKLVKADLVLFDSSESREIAQQWAWQENAIKHVLQNTTRSFSANVDGDTILGAERAMLSGLDNTSSPDLIREQEELFAAQSLKKFRTPGIYPYYRVHEALEFATQKKEVLVAIIESIDRITAPGLRNLAWENSAEKNGIPNVDDDNNGWVDDIYGINPLEFRSYPHSFSALTAAYVAATANYKPEKPANPQGKVKLLPIAAFRLELDSCGDYEWVSTDSAVIQSIEYAAEMGAQIIVMPRCNAFNPPNFYNDTSRFSPFPGDDPSLLLEAIKAFPGLIITNIEFNDRCFPRSLLLNAGYPHIIRVGYLSRSGPVDLYATYGAMVAGVAANLMSCNPQLDRFQVKDLILASIDQNPYRIGNSSTGGRLNAARAVLGRSTGGSFYIGNWALIDNNGPPIRNYYALAYDSYHGNLYLYGGRNSEGYCEDFWMWNGKSWVEINQHKEEGEYPGAVRYNPYMYYDEKRDQVVLLNSIVEEWRWDGNKWQLTKPLFPTRISQIGANYTLAKNTAYDPERNRVVYFESSSSKRDAVRYFLEFDGSEWREITNAGKLPKVDSAELSALIYNPDLKAVTMLQESANNKSTKTLWSYDGREWRSQRIAAVPGTGGIVVYDPAGKQYWRFGSGNLVRDRSGIYFAQGHDVVRFNKESWEHLGYDMPTLANEKGVWASDRNMFLLIGDWSESDKECLSLWQYSGAITPTWIDNMILPQSDYDGDGKADPALWHPGTGEFQLQNGTVATIGRWGDIPVPGDYNGDGKVEFAICRRMPGMKTFDPGSMLWISNGIKVRLGQFNDIPVPLDYDGDGKTDIAVFRKDAAEWIFQDKKKNTTFGNPADLPVPADYDGDGRVELATYTPLTSTWYIKGIGDIQYGKPGDSPVPADYDGDSRADIATWNPRTRQWLVRDWSSGGNMIKQRIGSKWDIPVPGDYDGDGKVELATFNPITARWNIQGRAPFTFGTAGDVPLVRGN